MDERRWREIADLEKEFAVAREVLDAHGVSLLYVFLQSERLRPINVYTILDRWKQWSFEPNFYEVPNKPMLTVPNKLQKPTARLLLPMGTQEPDIVDVYVISDDEVRKHFCKLIARAGLLLPAESRLDRYTPIGKTRDSWLGRLAFTWLKDQPLEFQAHADGGFHFGVIDDAFLCSQKELEFLRADEVDQATPEPSEFAVSSTPAADDSGFLAAKTLREQRGMDPAKCNKFLKRYGVTSTRPMEGKIRYRKPNRKVLEIHAADWLKFWQAVDRRRSDKLDKDGIQEFLATVEAEKSKVKAKRIRGSTREAHEG